MKKDIKNKMKFLNICVGVLALSACTQYTPSMMNSAPLQLSRTTLMEQIAVKDVNDAVLNSLASHYHTNGTSTLDLTMTYNPTSKSFTAMSAVHELKHVKAYLNKKGISDVSTQTMAVPNGTASLMVSYDMVQAMAPNDCEIIPTLTQNKTTRHIPDYKFGCSTETMLSKQIAHPADLEGNAGLATRDGRREAIVTDSYLGGEPREPLVAPQTDSVNIITN